MICQSTMDKASAFCRLGCGGVLLGLWCLVAGAAMAQGPAPTLIQAPQAYSGGTNALFSIPNAVALGDFNGDGLLDFAVVEYAPLLPGSSQVQIFIGHQDGSFTAGNIYTIGTISGQPFATNHTIGVGHFNGPGTPLGIAVAVNQAPGCASGGVVLLYGNGDGTFQPPTCLANPTGITSVAVADFNNDGFDDIAVGNASGATAGTITVYLNAASVNSITSQSGFFNYGSYSVKPLFLGAPILYGTIVAGNLPGQTATSLALLASTGPFTQYVGVIETDSALLQSGKPVGLTFLPSVAVAAPINFSDIALADVLGNGSASLVGIGAQGLQYAPVGGVAIGIATPFVGTFAGLSSSPIGLALASADFDGNGIPDFAFLDTNQNLGISLNPGSTTSSHIGPFGPAGQGVAAGFSTGLGKWVLVDAGVFVQLNPLFAQVDETRSVAVYLVDPTTGQPQLAPLYAQSPFLTTGTQRGFAVADFNGAGVPDVAVLGQDESTFAGTVSIFQNAYKTATPPGYAKPPTVIDLGILSGQGVGSITSGASAGYALVAGSFRFFDHGPDIVLVTSRGITLLENQGANTTGPFNFTLAPNCQGYFGAPTPTPPNNCYLGGDSHFPGLGFSPNSPRPPIIAVDVNGDGHQDVVVAYPENCNANTKSAIYVFLSNGDGTFQLPIYIPSPVVNPVGLAAGNLLGNGVPDLVVVNGGESCSGTQAVTGASTLVGAAIIPNTGNGTFGPPQTKPLFSQPSDVASPSVSSVALADMNGDGLLDVVISASDGIHVLLNTPGNLGTFTDLGAVPLYGTVLGFQDIITNTAQIDIADFNKDGTLDVAAAVGGIVYIFPGDGKGGLSTPVQAFASGPNSNQIRAIDVNGDGTADVLVNNSLGFSVLLNGSSVSSGNPVAQYELSPTLNFGGIARGAPTTQQLILENTGGVDLQLNNLALNNNVGNQYSFAFYQCSNGVFNSNAIGQISIPTGDSCTFNVTFTPNAIGTADAQLLIYDNAPTSNAPNVAGTGAGSYVQTITLNGAGIASQANVSINFASSPAVLAVGIPFTYTITLANSTPGSPATNLTFTHQLESSVQLLSVTTTGTGCNGTPTPGALVTCNIGTLPSGSSATITLTVTPTLAGALANPFSLSYDETANPLIAFYNLNILSSLTVNLGTIMENITVSDSPTFTDIPVSEAITISDQVFVTPLLGNFSPPAAAFSNSSLGFGNTTGFGSAQTLTLSNVGGGPLVFSGAPQVSAGFELIAAVCSGPQSGSLPSGGQCVFTIVYTGGPGAPTSGSIVFFDNAALSNPPSSPAIGAHNYSQTIQLNAAGSNSLLLNPPSATVTIPTISENINVTDAPNVNVPCQAVVSSQIGVSGFGVGFQYNPISHQYARTLTLTNNGATAIPGPLALVISGLSTNASLLNPSGTTAAGCTLAAGTPYVSVPTASLAPGGAVKVTLYFADPSRAAITFSTSVTAGSGAP
jgi:hypothetical protein